MEPDTQQLREKETGKVAGPAFDLPIEDGDLADLIDQRVRESDEFAKNTLKIDERRKVNEDFWLGNQLNPGDFADWQIPVKDNLIWQDLETRITIATSRMPDIIVTPADQTKEKAQSAKTLEQGLNLRINDAVTHRLLKDGLRFHNLDFTCAIKCYWDRNKDDFCFEIVKPTKVVFDHTATIPHDGFTSDNMEFICEWVEEPAAQVMDKFPSKKEAIISKLATTLKKGENRMNSKMRYQEVWFSFYGTDGTLYEGVCWKLGKTILDKRENPYYDWEGDTNESGSKVYKNHFDRPRKPYIFFSYQNIGRSAYDDTTPVEQSLSLQRIVNKRKRQVTEIGDRAVPKIIFSGDAITREEAKRITQDPDEHIVLNNNITDVRSAAMLFMPSAVPGELLTDLQMTMSQVDSKFATHSTTRGERGPNESGISKQITREGDIAMQDDLSTVVVERVIHEMSNWATQMMKLFYEKDHFVKNVGKDGELVYVNLKRDLVDDGIAVNVQSSSVDKAQKRFDAQTSAARRMIDPLSYWEDMDASNPKERTRRLITFLSGQFSTYAQMTDLSPDEVKDRGAEIAQLDIERLTNNEAFETSTPTEKYLQAFIAYVQTPDYKDLPKAAKKRFQNYVIKLKEAYQKKVISQPVDQSMQQPDQSMQSQQFPGAQGLPVEPFNAQGMM